MQISIKIYQNHSPTETYEKTQTQKINQHIIIDTPSARIAS